MKYKKYFLGAIAIAGLLPFIAFGTATDVTLTTDVTISVGGYDLTVNGSSATLETIVVNASDFTVTLQSGSTITVQSANKRTILISASGDLSQSTTCSGSTSSATVTGNAAATVTITPSSTACDATSSGSTGSGSGTSGGGSGGGGAAAINSPLHTDIGNQTQTTEPENTNNITTELPAVQASNTISGVDANFSSTLKAGMSGGDVRRLQTILASDSEIYPEGLITGYFGRLTQRAVERFQAKYGIVSSGTPNTTGYGLLGPKTRTKLAEVFGSSNTPAVEAEPAMTDSTPTGVSPLFDRPLSKGQVHDDVLRLQQILNSDPDTRIADEGVGSPGEETNYFGNLTEKAVQKFQEKYGLATQGNPGYGFVGPKTRAKLGEVFGENQVMTDTTDSSDRVTDDSGSTAGSAEAALLLQIQEALKKVEALQSQINSLGQ